jgi:hypothetical protein
VWGCFLAQDICIPELLSKLTDHDDDGDDVHDDVDWNEAGANAESANIVQLEAGAKNGAKIKAIQRGNVLRVLSAMLRISGGGSGGGSMSRTTSSSGTGTTTTTTATDECGVFGGQLRRQVLQYVG